MVKVTKPFYSEAPHVVVIDGQPKRDDFSCLNRGSVTSRDRDGDKTESCLTPLSSLRRFTIDFHIAAVFLIAVLKQPPSLPLMPTSNCLFCKA